MHAGCHCPCQCRCRTTTKLRQRGHGACQRLCLTWPAWTVLHLRFTVPCAGRVTLLGCAWLTWLAPHPLAAVAVSRRAPPHPNTCTLPAGAMFSGGCFWEGAGGKSNIADSRKGSENLWEFRVRLPSSYQDAEGMQG